MNYFVLTLIASNDNNHSKFRKRENQFKSIRKATVGEKGLHY
jgi:hypothetical protein